MFDDQKAEVVGEDDDAEQPAAQRLLKFPPFRKLGEEDGDGDTFNLKTKALLSFQVLETNVEMKHSHWRENVEFENDNISTAIKI